MTGHIIPPTPAKWPSRYDLWGRFGPGKARIHLAQTRTVQKVCRLPQMIASGTEAGCPRLAVVLLGLSPLRRYCSARLQAGGSCPALPVPALIFSHQQHVVDHRELQLAGINLIGVSERGGIPAGAGGARA